MRGTFVKGVAGCADWRSAAGEQLLWFALGGGPPDFWEVPGPVVVIGGCLAGRWGSARQGILMPSRVLPLLAYRCR
jgi:hypothetical protein